MATEAGDAEDEAVAAFKARARAWALQQGETLVAKGVADGALEADRIARALRTLIGLCKLAAPKAPQSGATPQEGDGDEDDIEPPRDDAEGLALRTTIVRGLRRLRDAGAFEPHADGADPQGSAGDGPPHLLPWGGSDTS